MPANLENTAVATGLEKVSFHSNPKERQCQRMLKVPHNCAHLMLQARLQQYVNCELPDVQAGFRKGRGSGNEVTQLCPTLYDPVDCSLPGSSIHGILEAKVPGVGCHFLLQGNFPT